MNNVLSEEHGHGASCTTGSVGVGEIVGIDRFPDVGDHDVVVDVAEEKSNDDDVANDVVEDDGSEDINDADHVRVALVGLPGSGRRTIGAHLATYHDYDFYANFDRWIDYSVGGQEPHRQVVLIDRMFDFLMHRTLFTHIIFVMRNDKLPDGITKTIYDNEVIIDNCGTLWELAQEVNCRVSPDNFIPGDETRYDMERNHYISRRLRESSASQDQESGTGSQPSSKATPLLDNCEPDANALLAELSLATKC
jgi:hypothetical protein